MPKPLAKLVSMLTPKRRWAQLSLGTLLVVVTAICLGLAWKIGEEQRRQEAIVAALDEKTELDFTDQPLSDVVDYLKARHEIDIQLDHKGLADAGVSGKVTITRNVKGVTLRSALDQLLSDLDLTFIVRGGTLLITTRAEAENSLWTFYYPIAAPLYDPESPGSESELIDAIKSTIEPGANGRGPRRAQETTAGNRSHPGIPEAGNLGTALAIQSGHASNDNSIQ